MTARMRPLAAALVMLCAAAPIAAADRDTHHPRHALRGTVTLDGAGATLRTCGDKGRDYAVVDATGGGEVTAAYRELAPQPGAPVFMELRGAVIATPPGARVDRALHVEAVERAEKQGLGCRRPLARFDALAIGSAPAWQIEVSRAAVTFASLDERGMLVFPPHGSEWPGEGALRYDGRSDAGHLAFAFEPGRCRDAATGNWYPLAARVVLNGTEYRGCAFRGRAGTGSTAAASATAPR